MKLVDPIPSTTSGEPASTDPPKWAEDLYRTGVVEQPLRQAVFTVEQLELHAMSIARTHELGHRRGDARLLGRLADSERVIATCHDLMSIAHAAGRRLTPAAEWLLDNHYLIEEQVFLAQKHLPRGYSRKLPRLSAGELTGLPRIYDIVLEFIAHVDGRVDDEALSRYIDAYQSVTRLTLGELWSVAIMLRLALIENLRRVAVTMSWKRQHRDCAIAWAQRLESPSDAQDGALLVLADLVRENPPLSTAFVAQFTQTLQGRGATTTFVLSWLEQRLGERGQTIEEVLRAENQSQAADQASMANSIASLRLVNATEWPKFVETHSSTEAILRGDPSGVYSQMDFVTRDEYRHVVENTARRLRLDEESVAQTAIALAAAHHSEHCSDAKAHVGYLLVDEGKGSLERALRGRAAARQPPGSLHRWLKLFAYFVPVTALTAVGALCLTWLARQAPGHAVPLVALCSALAASAVAIAVTNWFASIARRPRALPRMDFEHGIPDACRTMVVVPTLLSCQERIAETLEGLEIRYLANRDPNLWFGLLTDYSDAAEEHMEGDAALLGQAAAGIEALNGSYCNGEPSRFYLLHRPRLFNAHEGCWMGRERKRGKLEDFNAILCGDDQARFERIVGDLSQLTTIKYVITLDTDTKLPWGAGWRMVGAAAHPLNRPMMRADGRRLARGYAVLQPRVGISLPSAAQSHYSRLHAGDVGIDPYTRVVSDLYQDLFEEASYIGKGLYDVGTFRQLLDERFPNNAVLSHDLLESCFARAGMCSDVELLEDAPSAYLTDVSRRHRWMRGDWQLLPWLGLLVRDASGKLRYPSLTGLGWWKIFDNLRRTLVAPATAALLTLGFILLPSPLFFTLALLLVIFLPELLPGFAELWNRPSRLPLRLHVAMVGRSSGRRLSRAALSLAFLPYEALSALDAAARTLWRMFFSRRHLLEWQTAASCERAEPSSFVRLLGQMWVSPLLASALAAALITRGSLMPLVSAGPILLAWFLSPLLAWWISRPLSSNAKDLDKEDVDGLRRLARLTWRYFEVFVGPHESWLPPDNVQEHPSQRVAHRTSPTDMGLAMLSSLAAHDLGYLSSGQLLDRTAHTIESMEQLERYRGHFLNWYDTVTRKALRPQYVSTVDSGNLVAHVRVLRSGLLELPGSPVLPPGALEGLRDTFRILAEQVAPGEVISFMERLLVAPPDSLSAKFAWLSTLVPVANQLVDSFDRQSQPETAWWASAFDRQVRSMLTDLREMAPWLENGVGSARSDSQGWLAEADGSRSLEALGGLASRAAQALAASHDADDRLAKAFALGAERIASRLQQIDALARRCSDLTEADFTFLYDPRRKLLAIGYWVTERRLDQSCYDLLASEARLASYLAIASGQLPFEHWFALGRRLTTTPNRQVLLSWSGSMFEYLMPLLVMPLFQGTLLDQTCQAAVARQIEYGRQRGVPWGISESCYHLTDAEGTYQYRAFGVPGLGLQRGLADDLVIAPYATMLALLIDPRRAFANLRRLARWDTLGPYGFYDAIDFSASRTPDTNRGAVVSTYMSHHHGMSLLALGQAALGPRMQRRFLANPDLRAAALLLEERIPKASVILAPRINATQVVRRIRSGAPAPTMRVLSHPNTPVPQVHLLSNGRYHVMLSTAGAGYSRWNDQALTRWREDPTSESYGVFCYIGDKETRHGWSNSFQPTLRAGRRYEAVFTPGRAEFRRQDHQVETHTEIAVSTEDDLEIRRIRLTNRSARTRSLVFTGYADVVLAPGLTDELHRVFSNLFVVSEIIPEASAILSTRRPRSIEETSPWMFCLLNAAGDGMGACSYGTDRARFIGRGRSVLRPAALDDWGPLPETTGSVLDPCVALRREVALGANHTAQFDLVIGAAPNREAAIALISKYQDHRMADRVFEVAATHNRAVLSHLDVSELDALRYGKLASAVIFPIRAFRAPSSILRRNRKGQSGLWAYGISGDVPIVLLRIGDSGNLDLVRDLLRAHAFWRMQGLVTDLVIWNENPSGYRRTLDGLILGIVSAGTEAQHLDKPGGVFLRHVDSFPEEDRVLLQAVARIVMNEVDGSLDEQLARWQRATAQPRVSLLAPASQATPPSPSVPPISVRDDLLFSNGTGGFTKDGREYIVDLPPGRHTPAPWVNVIANERLGTVVSESGSAYTWYGNAQLGRLTPWNNDAVGDPSGEVIFLRDESSGRSFSPMPWPRAADSAYACRHGFGYSVFEHIEDGLETELTTFVAIDAPVKFLALKIRNLGSRGRTVSVLASMDLVLGDLRARHAMHVVTELEPLTGAILARNRFHDDLAETVAFFDCSEASRSVSGDRAEVLGRNGDPSNPAALRLRRLSGRLGPGLDPCAAMLASLELAPGSEREIIFVLGAGSSTSETISLIQRYRGVGAARLALKEVWQFWGDMLGVLYAETPDAALNVLVNGWLPYQVLSCRLLGRSGFYQSGGAYGFRDQLQDCVALLHEAPDLARQHLLRCAERQFVEGDVQHWWHPPSGRGVRTSCSDDYLWLPWAVSRYVAFTGDEGVLDVPIPYLSARALNVGEESHFDLPGRSDQTGTLYEHCTRAIKASSRRGAHGLPLMGSGDWNDGMNRVGHLGRGESVWLGLFLHRVLSDFALLARQRGDEDFAIHCLSSATDLADQVERHAWDGQWYRRAWFDDGEALGSSLNAECRIDSIPQSWATLAGVGTAERRRLALDSLWSQLVSQDLRIVKLFSPPFERSSMDPGYIKGYPPGVRENGGQYTHGAVWAAMAFALADRSEQAATLVSLLNPINHALSAAAVERYQVEPYVLAADIYSQDPHAGRGGWTWYTGSAAWLYRLVHEIIFGIERKGCSMRFRPRAPASWTRFALHYRYLRTFYHLAFTLAPDHSGPVRLTLDGHPLPDGILQLVDDRGDHAVEVLFGPNTVEHQWPLSEPGAKASFNDTGDGSALFAASSNAASAKALLLK